jgi:hypothetical protein
MPRVRIAPLAASLALGAGLLTAQPAPAEPEKSCGDQIAALCPDTEANSPERRACIKDKRAKLSEECQKRLGPPEPAAPSSGSLADLRPLVEGCKGDSAKLSTLCNGPNSSGNPLLECIVAHKSDLSKSCVDVAEGALKKQRAGSATPSK